MKRFYFDLFSRQALSELHRYRAVKFSPTRVLSLKHVHFFIQTLNMIYYRLTNNQRGRVLAHDLIQNQSGKYYPC